MTIDKDNPHVGEVPTDDTDIFRGFADAILFADDAEVSPVALFEPADIPANKSVVSLDPLEVELFIPAGDFPDTIPVDGRATYSEGITTRGYTGPAHVEIVVCTALVDNRVNLVAGYCETTYTITEPANPLERAGIHVSVEYTDAHRKTLKVPGEETMSVPEKIKAWSARRQDNFRDPLPEEEKSLQKLLLSLKSA